MAKYFKVDNKFIGQVKAGTTTSTFFEKLPDMPKVISVTTSCGCTVDKWSDLFLEVKFTAKAVPLHLKKIGYYEVTQTVTISYDTEEKDILRFTAKVTD